MAASDIPVEAVGDYLESVACKMIDGGIPAERVLDALKLTAVRVQALYPASTPGPTKVPLAPPPDAPTFAAVLERLQAKAKPQDSREEVEERAERRKAGRPWWKPAAEVEPSEAAKEDGSLVRRGSPNLDATRPGTHRRGD